MDLQREKELVERARDGDANAFGALFDEHYSKILGYILKRVGVAAVAEDIVSEVFYKAQKGLWRFAWQNVPFSAWLYRIATNEINGYFRKGVFRRSISLDALIEGNDFDIADANDLIHELEHAERELEQHALFLAVQKEIAKLPEKYQEVVTLRFFENKKVGDIANILNKKEGTVKSLLSSAVEQLRNSLSDLPASEKTQMQPLYSSSVMDGERSL
jgi:RNA polymerase sigma-70 factor (ECF subfamily)